MLRGDHRGVGLAMAKNVNSFRGRFEENGVWAALHGDVLDGLQGLGIPHDDGTAAAKAVVGLGVNRDATSLGVGNGADRLERVQVKHQNLAAARNIEAAAVVVRIDIINPAGPRGLGDFENPVRCSRGS